MASALRDGLRTVVRAGRRARSLAGPLLRVHLAFTALNAAVLAPGFAAVVRTTLGLSGAPVLADAEIARALLHPAGAAAAIVLAAIAICLQVLALGAMMTVAARVAAGEGTALRDVAGTLVRRLGPLLLLAVGLIGRVSAIAAPFLAVSAGLALALLGEHDINWYLDQRPPAFWTATAAIGLVATIMLGVLTAALVRWSLILPLVLFEGIPARRAFAASAAAARPRRRVVGALGAWLAIALLLGAAVSVSTGVAVGLLGALAGAPVAVVVAALGLAVAVWLGVTIFVTAATSALLALVLVDLAGLGEPVRRRAAAQARRRRPAVPAAMAVPLAAIVAGLAISLGLLHGAGAEDQVAVIAHRGASAIAPENSLPAIEAAVAAGADWVEIDVQETADGTVLVAHDRDFMKIAGVPLAIHAATMADIARIDIGSGFGPAFTGERAPTLAEALDAIRGRSRLLIELKYHGFQDRLEERVAAVVDGAGMAGEVAVMSLDPDGLARMRALRPDWRAGAVVATTIGDRTALGGDFLAVRAATVDRRLLRRARAAGIQVYAWTVNDPLEMSRLASLGIDGLITDDPALARQVLENRAGIGLPGRLLLHAAAVIGVRAGAAPPAEQRP